MVDKIENTKKVISMINKSDKGLFFGDSKSDYSAAKIFGINFVFVKRFSEWRNGNKRNASEGNLVIKQNKLYDNIYIKEK